MQVTASTKGRIKGTTRAVHRIVELDQAREVADDVLPVVVVLRAWVVREPENPKRQACAG